MDTYRENTRDLTVDLKDLFYRILAGWKGAVIMLGIVLALIVLFLIFLFISMHF